MDSPRADLRMVIGYDFADPSSGEYTALCAMRHREDGTLEVLDVQRHPPGRVDREGLLSFCFDQIRHLKPHSVSVKVGDNPPLDLDPQTVSEIINGTKTPADFLIGS